MTLHDNRSLRADLIERITTTAGRRLVVVRSMAQMFPAFPSEKERYRRLRRRKAVLEHGLAHLGEWLAKSYAANQYDTPTA